jgi:RNA polymerase II subunit A C-terminal domain phosphatase SSU72
MAAARLSPDETQLRDCISIALICQSNLNRSMEAHWVLQEKGHIRSYSFGAGSKVRLPGETMDRPHVYEFGTTYDAMYKSVQACGRKRNSAVCL